MNDRSRPVQVICKFPVKIPLILKAVIDVLTMIGDLRPKGVLDWPSSLDQAWPHPGNKPVAIRGTKTILSKNPFLTWAGQSVSSA